MKSTHNTINWMSKRLFESKTSLRPTKKRITPIRHDAATMIKLRYSKSTSDFTNDGAKNVMNPTVSSSPSQRNSSQTQEQNDKLVLCNPFAEGEAAGEADGVGLACGLTEAEADGDGDGVDKGGSAFCGKNVLFEERREDSHLAHRPAYSHKSSNNPPICAPCI
jgi:hypothetical protein